MSEFFFSFTLYAIPANLIVGVFYVMGREKAGLLKSEYPFIYLPGLALMLLSWGFFGETKMLVEDETLRLFIVIMQAFSSGVLGGFVLLPRYFFPAETMKQKLRITFISALVFSAVYVVSRVILYVGIRAVI